MKNFSAILFSILVISATIITGFKNKSINLDKPLVNNGTVQKEKIILLDRYFNSEKRKDSAGNAVYWHYTWEEKGYPGFSVLGDLFKQSGAKLASLDTAPRIDQLSKVSVYIIVDPDHVKDNPAPNYITEGDAQIISDWVKAGGVLLLMANDSPNCDLEHFNLLASAFGINFSNTSRNLVQNDEFETGVIKTASNPVFRRSYKMFLKDISILDVKQPAKSLVTKNGETVFAIASYGKGTVFAVGDPWLYNEYIDTRRLPAGYDNYLAAEDLVKWLLNKSMTATK